MTDIQKAENARAVYQTIRNALDHRNWHYTPHDDDMVVTYKVSGDDLLMEFLISVDERRQMARMLSFFPFDVPEDKRIEGAIMTCAATNKLAVGSFDFSTAKGRIAFRLNAPFLNCTLGEDLFSLMIDIAVETVDQYNDKFFAVSKGLISIEDYLNQL